MALELVEQDGEHVHAAPVDLDEPGLVVEPGGDDVHLVARHLVVLGDEPLALRPAVDAVGDLPVSALHAVAETDGAHAAVLVAGPGVHRHGVGVVEEEGAGFGDLADVLAEVEQLGDGARRRT